MECPIVGKISLHGPESLPSPMPGSLMQPCSVPTAAITLLAAEMHSEKQMLLSCSSQKL